VLLSSASENLYLKRPLAGLYISLLRVICMFQDEPAMVFRGVSGKYFVNSFIKTEYISPCVLFFSNSTALSLINSRLLAIAFLLLSYTSTTVFSKSFTLCDFLACNLERTAWLVNSRMASEAIHRALFESIS